MTQLNKSTYFPSGVLTHILSYCADTIERKQQKRMKMIVNAFKEIFKVRNEEGIYNIMGGSDKSSLLDASLFVPYSDILFQLNSILITPCRIDGTNQDFKEIKTCTVINDTCTLNSYTKIGTMGYKSEQYFRTIPPPLIYSQCTNY
tara:strand:+ start:525 stop:962 length:438 start_codon:yes stop_codon:yes gene_type:complete